MNPIVLTLLVFCAGVLLFAAVGAIKTRAASPEIVYEPCVPSIDIPKLIRAIKVVENWTGFPGPKGERGPMQFTEARWKELSNGLPFFLADRIALTHENRFHVDAVDTRHVTDLITKCYVLGKRPTVFLVAELHCAGFEAVRDGHVKAAKRDQASRIQNVYTDLK